MKILLVDDSRAIAMVMQARLESFGYEVRHAINGEVALDYFKTDSFDLILMDIEMPGMNGFEALRLMRRDAETAHIPIVMISGNEQATEQFYANRIGADDFMKKPFSRYEVFSRIERLLDQEMVPRRKVAERSQ